MNENDTISRQSAITNYQRVCRGIACNDCPFLIRVTDTLTDCRLERFLHDQPSALPSADPEVVKVLKMVEEYKEKTGTDEIIIMPKNGMKAWDENGVEYTMQPTCNNLATDTISRKEAINALIERDPNCGIDSAEVIKELRSAKPNLKGAKFEIICSQRQTGRTTKLIEKCARYRYALIVCPSRMRASNIFHYARKMGIHIPMPMTFGDFLRGRFAAEHINAFLIDDLDSCLAIYAQNVPIDTVVFEGRAEE